MYPRLERSQNVISSIMRVALTFARTKFWQTELGIVESQIIQRSQKFCQSTRRWNWKKKKRKRYYQDQLKVNMLTDGHKYLKPLSYMSLIFLLSQHIFERSRLHKSLILRVLSITIV